MSAVCQRLGTSRAAYYKRARVLAHRRACDMLVSALVMGQRREMPRLGGRKLYHLLGGQLAGHGVRMGRDRLFAWLRSRGLLVEPKKRYCRTTHSSHRFRVYTDLVKGRPAARPDQVWVSDITYLRTREGFCYLALVTDAYSRKVVGWDVSRSLELEGCMRAVAMACAGREGGHGTVHHSDRGTQYCSHAYTGYLRENGIAISMGEAGNCYDNAMAERVNGILKGEFNLDRTFFDLRSARRATQQAIQTYNDKRPHMALDMRKPSELYAA